MGKTLYTQEMWDETISFYENLVTERCELAPLLSLVKKIARTDYSKVFYPSTSHDDLCISSGATYLERQDVPMITIQYTGEQFFKIQFWSKPTRTHDAVTYKCNSSESWSLLEALFTRLKVETDNSFSSV